MGVGSGEGKGSPAQPLGPPGPSRPGDPPLRAPRPGVEGCPGHAGVNRLGGGWEEEPGVRTPWQVLPPPRRL